MARRKSFCAIARAPSGPTPGRSPAPPGWPVRSAHRPLHAPDRRRRRGDGDDGLLIACGQEAPLFRGAGRGTGLPEARFRRSARPCRLVRTSADRAGRRWPRWWPRRRWPCPPARRSTSSRQGACLILGPGEAALAAAERLADTLAVTVLLTGRGRCCRPTVGFDVDPRAGWRAATGTLGALRLSLRRATASFCPAAAVRWRFADPRDGAGLGLRHHPRPHRRTRRCSRRREKRDGYLRADPGSRRAPWPTPLHEAAQMVGTFEKPLYIRLDENRSAPIPAPSRPAAPAASTICPTGAISPGRRPCRHRPDDLRAAAAPAPRSAPRARSPTTRRPPLGVRAARAAGRDLPQAPAAPRRGCWSTTRHGAEMIRLAARFGRGLPADVIPLEVDGAGQLSAMPRCWPRWPPASPPSTCCWRRAPSETPGARGERALAEAMAPGAATVCACSTSPTPTRCPTRSTARRPAARPDARSCRSAPAARSPGLPPRRCRRRHHPAAAAAAGAPYGAVLVDTGACTLCLSCVSLCPSGALGGQPRQAGTAVSGGCLPAMRPLRQ